MTPSFLIPARLKRSRAPIQRSRSGFTGFFTSTGMSVSFRASAISCTRKGLAVVLAPIHTRSTPCLRHSKTCFSLATSVAIFKPYSFFALCIHFKPGTPVPSKHPGWVRGFQIPARNTLMPKSLSPAAVVITCSSVSALQGPAITLGLGSVNMPHSYRGTSSKFLFAIMVSYLIILLILLASVINSLIRSSSESATASLKAFIFSM